MHVRFHVLPASAAPGASLFALRHSAGHLLRDSDGKVILCPDVEAAERERRKNSASAPVSYVVALVPESDVREADAAERLAEALAKTLGLEGALRSVPDAPNLSLMKSLVERMRARIDAGESVLYVPSKPAKPDLDGGACPRCQTRGLRLVRAPAGDVFYCVKCRAMPANEAVGLALHPPCWPPQTILDRHRIMDSMAAMGLSWDPLRDAERFAEEQEAPATGGDVQSDDSAALRAAEQVVSTMKIGDTERPIVENTAGQWTDTPPATEIPPVALTVDPRVQEALTAKAPRKGRRQ